MNHDGMKGGEGDIRAGRAFGEMSRLGLSVRFRHGVGEGASEGEEREECYLHG